MADTKNIKDSSSLLTEGSIWRKIVVFAFPLFMSNLFQQLYNAADSLIVGNLIGPDALASVSSSGNLIFLLVGFFNGIAMGAGVVIAHAYGAGDYGKVERSVHTIAALSLVCGVLMTFLGVLLAPLILIWMGTPASILPGSTTYFRIYFLGSVPFVFYNAEVGILQAVGDSRHPMYYLIFSSCLNVVLDLLFVGPLHMGVGGAALATILSQAVSAGLGLFRLIYSPDTYRLRIRQIRFHKEELLSILRNGIPMGMQNSIIAFANVIVQSNINAFGQMAVAGQGAYAKVEGFAFLPITCFAMALTTFIGQNIGAEKYDRVRKGARFGLIVSMILAEAIGLLMFLLGPFLIGLFSKEPEVIRYGVGRIRICCFFYCFLAFSHGTAGVLRGAGRSIVPMLVMLVWWCIFRVIMITIWMKFMPSIDVVNWAYPITWTLASVTFMIYYKMVDWQHGSGKEKGKTKGNS